jgi:hypothetical protein
MLDPWGVWETLKDWKPNSSMNHEYVFVWKSDLVSDSRPAAEQLESGPNLKWVDLSYVKDGEGRYVYILEIGQPPDDFEGADIESMDGSEEVQFYERVWDWKSGGIGLEGPFASEEAAEGWMRKNGAFEEVD